MAAFCLLLVTGALDDLRGRASPYSFTWIYLSLILFPFAFLTGGFVLTARHSEAHRHPRQRGPYDPEFLALSKRSGED